jgi:hypothetical protein
MPSTYSTNLKIELIATGEQSGTWGNTTNTNLGTLLEEAIAGYVTQAVTDGAATVLTIPNGTSSNGRNYVIELTGALTAARTVEVPAVDKPYIFFNNTTGGFSVTVKVSGQTGVTIANGKRAIVYTNSIDVIEVVNAPVSEAGTQTLTNKTLTSPALSGNVVLTSNSSSDAFRITQTGAGNALVVEDSANPDATPFVIDAEGRALSGGTTSIPAGSGTASRIQVQMTAGLGFSATQYEAGAGGATVVLAKSRNAAIGGNTVVQSGDTLGTIRFAGDDGSNLLSQGGNIQCQVDGTPGTNDMPGRLVFNTTADGASSPTERMRITSAGNVGIGTTSPGALLTVFGTSAPAARVQDATSFFEFYTNGGTSVLSNAGAGALIFSNNGAERMRITSAGRVGIGTTTPAVSLAISSTDSILVPVGTTGERPTGATGYLRFNTTTTSFEGFNGTAWGSIGGGAAGGGTDAIFYNNGQTVTTNYSIPSGQNAGTFGPITINSGVTVTVPSGSTWSIV